MCGGSLFRPRTMLFFTASSVSVVLFISLISSLTFYCCWNFYKILSQSDNSFSMEALLGKGQTLCFILNGSVGE